MPSEDFERRRCFQLHVSFFYKGVGLVDYIVIASKLSELKGKFFVFLTLDSSSMSILYPALIACSYNPSSSAATCFITDFGSCITMSLVVFICSENELIVAFNNWVMQSHPERKRYHNTRTRCCWTNRPSWICTWNYNNK